MWTSNLRYVDGVRGTRVLTVYVPMEMREAVIKDAAERGCTMSDIARRALYWYFKEHLGRELTIPEPLP